VVCIPCDGIVELHALFFDIADPEHDIFLTGAFNSRISKNDNFIPLDGVGHTSVRDICTVDTFNIPHQSLDKGNVNKFGFLTAINVQNP